MFFSLGLLLFIGHDPHPNPTKTYNGPPSVHHGEAPTACFDGAGRLFVVFVAGDHVYVSSSPDKGQTFSEAVKVNAEPESLSVSGENRPQIAVDKQGRVFVAYTRSLPARFTGHVMFSRSLDGGLSFEKPRQLNDDTQVTGHAFAVMGVNAQQRLYLAWLDGRDRIAAEAAGETTIGSSLYATYSDDGGASFVANQRWATGTCQCCRLALAFDGSGEPWLVWRHIFDDNIRDHALGHFTAGGSFEFGRLTFDQWHIDGCPHQGPALSIDSAGRRHVTWFTLTGNVAQLFYGSADKDGHWLTKPQPMGSSAAIHPVILDQGPNLYRAWLESDGKGTRLMAGHSLDQGQTWSDALLASAGSTADHPFLLASGGSVYVAWSDGQHFQVLALKPATAALEKGGQGLSP